MSQDMNLGDDCCCGPSNPGSRRIPFTDGSQAGIIGLDEVMEDLYREGKPADDATAMEMVNRLQQSNYIVPSAKILYQNHF